MTAITEFYDAVRFMIGDHDDDARLLADNAIARGVRTVIKGGRVPKYSLDAGSTNVTPTVTDPNDWMLIPAYVAKMWTDNHPERQTTKTRPFTIAVGSFKGLSFEMDVLIYKLENGEMFHGWSSFASWLEGMAGVPQPFLHFTRLKVNPGFIDVTVGAGTSIQ